MRKSQNDFITTYIDYTKYQNAPEIYHRWTALSLLASTLQRRVYMNRAYFYTFPNLYTALVGPTGFTKSTASDIGMNLLKTLPQIETISGEATSWYLYSWFGNMSSSGNPCCCTIYSDEMKNLLGDLNKTDMITLLTKAYTCPASHDHHTKSGGKLTLKNICINVLVCSTPEWLVTGTTTNEIAGGFTGRFVYVYADQTDRSYPFPEDWVTPDIKQLRLDLEHDLTEIEKLSGPVIITDQAKAEYIIWYQQREQECNDERLRGYYSRKGELVLKTAILLSVAQDDSLVIDDSTLHNAWALLTETEVNMCKTFSGVVDDPALKYKDLVLGQIARAHEQIMTREDLLKKNWTKFDGVILDRIITNMNEAGFVIGCTVMINKKKKIAYKLIKQGP